MTALLWRLLPGPLAVRLVLALLVLAAVVAALFTWVFPAVDAMLFPADDVVTGG